ncbi:hypothetical protein [Kitasatospora sp. NPDC057541]|uniref:hypothetical protein n=1 Tax=unclassified Kitasatospora TaxID=2633591 RepID=UPI00367C580C
MSTYDIRRPETTLTIRRTTLTAAASLLALSAVAACNDDTQSAPTAAGTSAAASTTTSAPAPAPTPSATTSAPAATPSATASVTPTATAAPSATGAPVDASGAFDPVQALTTPDLTPYAATMNMTVVATGAGGEQSTITSTGRTNVNTPVTESRTETKTLVGGSDEPLLWVEVVNTGKGIFMRDKTKPGSTWTPSGTSSDDSASDTATTYAKALAESGPAARKGMEQKNGVPAYHLGGRLTIDRIKSLAPKEHQRMSAKGVTAIDFDIWIDRGGRVLALRQTMKVPDARVSTVTTVTSVTYSDFGPRETFTAPTAAATTAPTAAA